MLGMHEPGIFIAFSCGHYGSVDFIYSLCEWNGSNGIGRKSQRHVGCYVLDNSGIRLTEMSTVLILPRIDGAKSKSELSFGSLDSLITLHQREETYVSETARMICRNCIIRAGSSFETLRKLWVVPYPDRTFISVSGKTHHKRR